MLLQIGVCFINETSNGIKKIKMINNLNDSRIYLNISTIKHLWPLYLYQCQIMNNYSTIHIMIPSIDYKISKYAT